MFFMEEAKDAYLVTPCHFNQRVIVIDDTTFCDRIAVSITGNIDSRLHLSLSLSLSLSLFLFRSLSLSLSFAFYFSHTLFDSLSLSFSFSRSLFLFLFLRLSSHLLLYNN